MCVYIPIYIYIYVSEDQVGTFDKNNKREQFILSVSVLSSTCIVQLHSFQCTVLCNLDTFGNYQYCQCSTFNIYTMDKQSSLLSMSGIYISVRKPYTLSPPLPKKYIFIYYPSPAIHQYLLLRTLFAIVIAHFELFYSFNLGIAFIFPLPFLFQFPFFSFPLSCFPQNNIGPLSPGKGGGMYFLATCLNLAFRILPGTFTLSFILSFN